MATLVLEAETIEIPVSTRNSPRNGPVAGRASWPTIRIDTEGATYVGQVCMPETKRRLSDVLADERPFLHLVNVSINGDAEREPFLALNKRFIRAVRIVDEDKLADLVLVPTAD